MRTVTFPQSGIPAKVCDLLYGADGAISQCTDGLMLPSMTMAELFAFKHNIALTPFVSNYDRRNDNVLFMEQSGRCRAAIYYPTDRWKHPNTGTISVITDYESSTWSAAGAALYGVTAGTAKAVRYPNHGQELYDLTEGALGFDYLNGVPGTSEQEELIGVIEAVQDYFEGLMGRKATAISYRNGKDNAARSLMPYFVGGRNSQTTTTGPARTSYGKSRDTGDFLGYPEISTSRLDLISQPCTTRWHDSWKNLSPLLTKAQANAYAEAAIADIKTNKGWYNDFIHWHSVGNMLDFDIFFGVLNSAIDTSFFWRCSYEEAFEYLMFREMARKVAANVVGDTIEVLALKVDPFRGTAVNGIPADLDLSQITVPISIRIDISGTALAGSELATNNGTIIKVATDIFIVNIPFSNACEGAVKAVLSETTTPNYLDFSLPEIVSANYSDGKLTVITNRPTKAVAFSTLPGEAITTAVVAERSATYLTTHVFTLTPGKDIYAGVISKEGQSIISAAVAI